MRRAFRRFFGSKEPSKNEAKKRLKLLLIHDQIDLAPSDMEDMKLEIIEVIRKYVEINEENTEFSLDREQESVKLVSSIQIRRVVKPNHPAA
jgi:cell division topological specificity factor